jgi:hypothetical protein
VGPATPAPSRVHFILPVRGPPSGVPRAMASKPPPPCRRRRGRGRGLALPGVHARARGRVRPLFRSPPPQRAPTRLATKDGRASHGSARCAGGGRDGARPPTRPCHAPRHPTCNLIRPSSQKGLALAEGFARTLRTCTGSRRSPIPRIEPLAGSLHSDPYMGSFSHNPTAGASGAARWATARTASCPAPRAWVPLTRVFSLQFVLLVG